MKRRTTPRPSWDRYFLQIAEVVASRSTCPRASVGAVIVKDFRIISTGYNGSLPGELHCIDVGCLMVNGHCERVIHAEMNAVAQAAKMGVSVDGATLYYYDSLMRPAGSCSKCSQVMAAAGIDRLVSRNGEESLNWIRRIYKPNGLE